MIGLRENSKWITTYSIGTVPDSASNVLEEATDIPDEMWMIVRG